MTLYDKIIELGKLGFDIKFERFLHTNMNPYCSTRICIRYHGNVGVKIDNNKSFTPEKMANEKFIVSEIDRMYKEMKYHCYAEGHYFREDRENYEDS